MTTENTELVAATVTAALTTVDPTLGVGSVVIGYLLNKFSTQTALRAGTIDILFDAMTKGDEERQRQYREVKDDAHRLNLLIDGLREELQRNSQEHEQKLQTVQLQVAKLLEQHEVLLKEHPETEMRPYLVAAASNRIHNPKRFTSAWVRRLNTALLNISIEHVQVLQHYFAKSSPPKNARGYRSAPITHGEPGSLLGDEEEGLLVFNELIEQKLLERGAPSGESRILVTQTGARLAEYLTPTPSRSLDRETPPRDP